MTLEFKTTYLKAIRRRYFNATRKGKSGILNELCQVTGYSRKHAIRVLATGHMTGKKNSGRTTAYSEEARIHLQKLWHTMGRICSKKMVAALPIWLEYYQRPGFTTLIKQELLTMSSSTIDRYLKTYKRQFARRKRTGTRRSKKFNNIIPIKSFDKHATKPGYIQADTVAHYSAEAICNAFWKLPFKPISFNSDNGTEFLNSELYGYISKDKNIAFTRSRPYKKNDNAHVEQKNFTHVRELFGYDRYDFEELVDSMNEIYRNYFNILHNFFIPQQKLLEKTRVGSKYVKKYDEPKTPYQRLLNSKDISKYEKEKLRKRYEELNPIQLTRDLNNKMKLFKRQLDKLKKEKQDLIDYYAERNYKAAA